MYLPHTGVRGNGLPGRALSVPSTTDYYTGVDSYVHYMCVAFDIWRRLTISHTVVDQIGTPPCEMPDFDTREETA